MLGMSRVAAELAASRAVLTSTDLDYFVFLDTLEILDDDNWENSGC
jgi:hypothetical protein